LKLPAASYGDCARYCGSRTGYLSRRPEGIIEKQWNPESGKKIVIEVMYKTVSDPMKYWIIGSGKFGVRAAEILYQKHPSARITLVDSNPESLAGLNLPCKIVCTDGIGFLIEALESGEMPDWVVPCIPVHLAFRWLAKSFLPACHLEVLRVPESLIYLLPNPFRGPEILFATACRCQGVINALSISPIP
jgi:hypothetical protein